MRLMPRCRKERAALNRTPASSAPQSRKIRYIDCLKGRAPVPTDPVAFFLFHVLMVGGMVTFMATFNGIRHDGIAFLEYMHWFYPLVFLFAFIWRRTAANAVTSRLIPRVIAPRFTGTAGSAAKSFANVTCMAPFVCLWVSLLLEGAGFWDFYLSTVFISWPLAILVNFFIVGPVVKMTYNNRIKQRTDDAGIIHRLALWARPWASILGLS